MRPDLAQLQQRSQQLRLELVGLHMYQQGYSEFPHHLDHGKYLVLDQEGLHLFDSNEVCRSSNRVKAKKLYRALVKHLDLESSRLELSYYSKARYGMAELSRQLVATEVLTGLMQLGIWPNATGQSLTLEIRITNDYSVDAKRQLMVALRLDGQIDMALSEELGNLLSWCLELCSEEGFNRSNIADSMGLQILDCGIKLGKVPATAFTTTTAFVW